MPRSRRKINVEPDRSSADQYIRAATVYLPKNESVHIVLVGIGGTGGWLAPSLARLAYVMKKDGKPIDMDFVDPDVVEKKNIGRQNFCEAEIGKNKAETLAVRYAKAWGLEIAYRPSDAAGIFNGIGFWNKILIIVGCVDNAKARHAMLDAMKHREGKAWWLDCGNAKDCGQVLLGNCADRTSLEKAVEGNLCKLLPAPTLQAPNLLVPRPEEKENANLSCAELAAANMQDLAVNQRTAAEAADMLFRLLVTRNLNRFATYFDLASGTARSRYCTQEAIKQAVKKGK